MPWNETARPADHRTVTTGKRLNIFMAGEALTFTLSAGAATTYVVRDYYGTSAATGSLPAGAGTLTIDPLPLGWYKLYLVRPSAAAAPWGLAGGELPFIVTRASAVLPVRPAVGASGGSDPLGEGIDYATSGFLRKGPYRHSMRLDSNYANDLSACISDIAYEASCWGTPDAQRPLRPIMNFHDGGLTSGTQSNFNSAISQAVSAGCPWFEYLNEPNVSIGDQAGYANGEFANFSTSVRAQGGKAFGPCTIGVNGDANSDSGGNARWLNNFLATAGAPAKLDGISFHNYNGVGGSLRVGRKTLDGFVALLTKYGVHTLPRYNTEALSTFAAVYGSYEPRLQTQWSMLELHLLEQYGVPKEQCSIFYDRSHGFWDFPSWWINSESTSTLNPLAAVLRIWSDELAGKAFAARLDFGTTDNEFWLGSRFTAPSGASVLALQSGGRIGAITLQVTGSGVTSLTVVNPWGELSTVPVTGGLAAVGVGTLPTYVRLPAGAAAVPVIVNYGVDTIKPRAAQVPVSASTPTVLPATLTYTFPNATRFDTVTVTTGPPWQSTCGLLDFDVQALVGGTWTTVATQTVPTNTIAWSSHRDSGGCYTDSYYPRTNQFVISLTQAVNATAVRLYVRDVTYGGGATLATTNGAGNASGTGQTGPKSLAAEISVYLSGKTDGGTASPGQPFLALR